MADYIGDDTAEAVSQYLVKSNDTLSSANIGDSITFVLLDASEHQEFHDALDAMMKANRPVSQAASKPKSKAPERTEDTAWVEKEQLRRPRRDERERMEYLRKSRGRDRYTNLETDRDSKRGDRSKSKERRDMSSEREKRYRRDRNGGRDWKDSRGGQHWERSGERSIRSYDTSANRNRSPSPRQRLRPTYSSNRPSISHKDDAYTVLVGWVPREGGEEFVKVTFERSRSRIKPVQLEISRTDAGPEDSYVWSIPIGRFHS